MKKTIIPMATILVLLILTGCAPSLAESRATFCQDLAAYGQAALTLKSVDADTTVDELNEARDDLVEARQAVFESASDLRETKLNYIEDAWEELEDTVQNMPGEATLGEAALRIRAQATVLDAEIARLNSVICSR